MEFFESVRARPSPDLDAPATASTPYHPTAAVLAAFDPATIKGVAGATEPPSDADLRRLLADSTPLPDSPGSARWSLNVERRKSALATFKTREEIREARRLNEGPTHEPLQRLLDGFILGPPPDISAMDAATLQLASQAVGWLTGVPSRAPLDLPELDEIRRRLDLHRLVSPLRRLAGEHFQGRIGELERISRHINGPPGPPMVIWGLGGIGKSALVARAALDLIQGHDTQGPSPVVYLDFDRKSLPADQPAALLLDSARQVNAQAPPGNRTVHGRAGSLVSALSGDLAPETGSESSSSVSALLTGTSGLERLNQFQGLLEAVPEWSGKPLLVIIDTFEDVQYRSKQTVDLLLNFLGKWQDKVPAARVIIAGRARVEGRQGPEIELKGLDADSAIKCLIDLRVPAESATFIVERVGGSPLALHLAADLVRRESAEALTEFLQGKEFAEKLDEVVAEGFLFRRVIEQIRNVRIRKLAHPGLVLRYLTPELIQKVLAGPCQVDVPDETVARKLWEDLARETSLVRVEGGDRLRHRPDLRREMIMLLRRSRKGQAAAIHLAAVDYFAREYERSHDPADRAEELYHRLCLEQPHEEIDPRWLPAAEPLLRGAQEELPPKGLAYLAARVGGESPDGLEAVGVSDDFWEQADQTDWERKTAHWVRDLIRQERYEEALKALRERPRRHPDSPLWFLEAVVLKNLANWNEAARVLQTALSAWPEEGDVSARLDLLLLLVRVQDRLGDSESARHALERAIALTGAKPTPAQKLEIATAEVRLVQFATNPHEVHLNLSITLEEISDRNLAAMPSIARRAAAELVENDVDAVGRVLGLVGLGPTEPGTLAAIQNALNEVEPVLEGSVAIPLAEPIESRISRQLRGNHDLARLLAAALREGEEVSTRRSASTSAEYARAVVQALEAKLTETLLNVFDPSDFRRFIHEFDGELARMTPAEAGFTETVLSVVRWGERLGRTSDLVRAAAAERPDHPAFKDLLARIDVSNRVGRRRSGPQLPPRQKDRLAAALVEAFENGDAFKAMLIYRNDKPPRPDGENQDLGPLVRSIVERANEEGWVGELIAAAREARPKSPLLYDFAEDFGLTSARPEDDRRVREASPELDINAWRSRVGEAEGRIGRIEVSGQTVGVGFLIGPDQLLTSLHAATAIGVSDGARSARVVFDAMRLENGDPWNDGLRCRVVDAGYHATTDRLPYAILRTAESPGNQPVGWPRCEPNATARGWYSLATGATEPRPGDPLISFHYSSPGILRLAFDSRSVLNVTPTHIRHRGLLSMAGSPIFDINMNPIVLSTIEPRTDTLSLESDRSPSEESVGTLGLRLSAIFDDT